MGEKGPSRERAAGSRPRGDRPRAPPGSPRAGPERAAAWLPQALCGQRGDSAVAEVLRELLQSLTGECARAWARRERVPFTVGLARDALLQMAQWRFPLRDEGDLDPDGEDEEPRPCASDSWAEGAVPVLSPQRCPSEVPDPCTPFPGGQQDPDAVAEVGSSPVEPPFPGDAAPGPGPPTPEPPQDGAAAAPRFKRRPALSQAPVQRAASLRPARPPAPPDPPGPEPPPRSSNGDEEGRSVVLSGHKPRLPLLSGSSTASVWSGRAPRSSVPKRGDSRSAMAVPGPCPGRRPERWIRPHVEVLEPGAGRRRRGPDPSSSRLHRGPVSAAGPQLRTAAAESRPPPGAAPRPLGSLLDPARLAPGVSVRWGGSVRRGGRGEQEPEQEEAAELRPIRPSALPAVIAAGRVTGER